MQEEEIIQRGAEAVLYHDGRFVKKYRVKKGYRFPKLDLKLRRLRTRGEARLLEKARKLINVPRVEKVDEKKMEIDMEFIDGLKLSESLGGMKNWREVCLEIGCETGKLHDAGIIHGDLTTSNMIWQEKEGKLYLIDFGLGFGNGRVEDKAVDLHLIKQALEAKHFGKFESYWMAIVEGYRESKGFEKVMKQFEKVEKRGRYKNQY